MPVYRFNDGDASVFVKKSVYSIPLSIPASI